MNQSQMLGRAKQILLQEAEAISNIPLDQQLVRAVKLILKCKGKVVCSGMGKAGIVAQKVAATFSSTGTPAVFLHPSEAQHGDLGLLGKDDLLLLFSNSGKTREALELVHLTRQLFRKPLPIISITSHPENALASESHAVLSIGEVKEVCYLGMAPTTSTTCMMAMGDVLSMLVMEQKNFSKEDFHKRHHGGYLGSLKKKSKS